MPHSTSHKPCPICGSYLYENPNFSPKQQEATSYLCRHCQYQTLSYTTEQNISTAPNRVSLISPDIASHMKLDKAHYHGHSQDSNLTKQAHYKTKLTKLTAIYSDNMLCASEDINALFRQYHQNLIKGGELLLATPVKRALKSYTPQLGDKHIFKSSNIMLLLEQHGFRKARIV